MREDDDEALVLRARTRLWEWTLQPRVRDAIARTSPDVERLLDVWHARVQAGRRNTDDRKRERVLWRFLQRFTAKNDSTSFFGPIAAGRVDEILDPTTELPVQSGRPRTYVTQWVAEALVAAAAEDIGEALGALPTGLMEPEEYARSLISAAPPGPARDLWLGRADTLAGGAERWARTPGPERGRLTRELEAELGIPLRRRGGEYYASRGPFHEQAERTGSVVGLGPGWIERMGAALTPYAELCLLPTLAERWTMHGWMASRFPGASKQPVAWREVLAAREADGARYQLAAPPEARGLRRRVRTLRAELRAAVDHHLVTEGAAVPLRLDPATFASPAPPPLGQPYVNPDLLPCIAPDGSLDEVVLGEAHYLPMLTGNLLPSLALGDEVIAATRDWLATLCAPGRPALPWFEQHSFVSTAPDVGEVALEISGRADRPQDRRVPFDDLACRTTADGPVRFEHDLVPLTRTGLLSRVSPVYAVELFDLGSWLAGGDWRSEEELPRLSYGDLVVHRRTWRAVDLSDHRSVMALGLPRFTFIRAEGVAKPILIDWADPIAAELAAWTNRRHGPITLIEMLPEPGDLWLRSPQGLHTAELRMVWAGPDLV